MRWIDAGRSIMVIAASLSIAACSHSSGGSTAGTPSLAPAAPPDTEQRLTEARRLFDESQSGLALVRVEEYLNANPQSTRGHNLAGAIFDRIGRHDLAERHYQAALAQEVDYLPALNNFGLSKLHRARKSARPDLEQEAEALLARAISLSDDPEALLRNHSSVRAVLSARPAAPNIAAAPPAPVAPRSVWLERRGASFTYVVTRPGDATRAALMALDLDPTIALVSPGAGSGVSRVTFATAHAARLRSWTRVAHGAPQFYAATSGFSYLALAPRRRKPVWYKGDAIASARPVSGLTSYADAKSQHYSPDAGLNARVALLLNTAVLP